MNEPVYAPPKSNLEASADARLAEFYVVSLRKFIVLYLGTVGLYNLYWFYRQWSAHKQFSSSSVWPAIRALFLFIFAFPLFHAVHVSLKRQGIGAMPWWFLCAAFMTGNMIVGWLIAVGGQVAVGAEATLWQVLSLVPMAMQIGNLLIVQHKINTAALDPGGTSNASFSVANWAWIGFGSLIWVAGILLPLLTTLLLSRI